MVDFKVGIAGDTKISMNHTTKEIKDIKVGDTILGAFNDDNNSVRYTRVTNISKGRAKCLNISLNDGKVILVAEKHILLTQRGFVRAEDILEFDTLYKYNDDVYYDHKPGDTLRCVPMIDFDITKSLKSGEIDVYNIETECHTYIANDIVMYCNNDIRG